MLRAAVEARRSREARERATAAAAAEERAKKEAEEAAAAAAVAATSTVAPKRKPGSANSKTAGGGGRSGGGPVGGGSPGDPLTVNTRFGADAPPLDDRQQHDDVGADAASSLCAGGGAAMGRGSVASLLGPPTVLEWEVAAAAESGRRFRVALVPCETEVTAFSAAARVMASGLGPGAGGGGGGQPWGLDSARTASLTARSGGVGTHVGGGELTGRSGAPGAGSEALSARSGVTGKGTASEAHSARSGVSKGGGGSHGADAAATSSAASAAAAAALAAAEILSLATQEACAFAVSEWNSRGPIAISDASCLDAPPAPCVEVVTASGVAALSALVLAPDTPLGQYALVVSDVTAPLPYGALLDVEPARILVDVVPEDALVPHAAVPGVIGEQAEAAVSARSTSRVASAR